MATYDYDIVNLALVRLGANRITSLTDGSRNANEANAIYALVRDEILREHDWGFATRMQYLNATSPNVLTVTAITRANPGVVTYTGTDPLDGDYYEAASIGGMTQLNGNHYVVQGVNTVANTFMLYDTEGNKINTSAYGIYTAGGTFTQELPPQDTWSYVYTLPPLSLKVLQINEDPDEEFEVIENRWLLSNTEECFAKIIKQETDVTRYDPTFVDVFAWRLAAELSMILTGDGQKSAGVWQQYRFALSAGKAKDASEGRKSEQDFNRYTSARR